MMAAIIFFSVHSTLNDENKTLKMQNISLFYAFLLNCTFNYTITIAHWSSNCLIVLTFYHFIICIIKHINK